MPLDDKLKELTPAGPDSMLPEAEVEDDFSEAWQALLGEAEQPIDGMADTAAKGLKVSAPPDTGLITAVADALEEFSALLPGERYLAKIGTSSDSSWIRIYSRNSQRQIIEDDTRKRLDGYKAELARDRDIVSTYEARSGLERWLRYRTVSEDGYKEAKKNVQEHGGWVKYLEEKLDSLTSHGYWAEDGYAIYPHPQVAVGYYTVNDEGKPEFIIEVQPFVQQSANDCYYKIARALACHLRKKVKDLDISLTAHGRAGSDKDFHYRVPLSKAKKNP